jgi:hypothetical protein
MDFVMDFVTLFCIVCCYFIGLCYDVLKSCESCEPGEAFVYYCDFAGCISFCGDMQLKIVVFRCISFMIYVICTTPNTHARIC